MPQSDDGYRLNAQLRGQRSIPTTLMVDVLASLAFDMNQAAQKQPVLVEQWVTWVRKDRAHSDAVIRVLFMLVGIAGFTVDDIATLKRQLRDTSQQRRRPTQLIQGPRERSSPRLW